MASSSSFLLGCSSFRVLLVVIMAARASAYYKPTPWALGHATFYGDMTAAETMGGACGYGNLHDTGYGVMTAALSSVLFQNGYACGQCYQVRCTGTTSCYRGNRFITVTATNLCPPNWSKPSDDGGWCNPPRVHFDLSMPAFVQIADYIAGIVPIMYRRVSCQRKGGIRFQFQGNAYWLLVFAMNVGGAGDVSAMSVRGSGGHGGWIGMSHNWGASYQAFSSLVGQALSFKVTSYSTERTIILRNVAPENWYFGLTYEAKMNFR